VLYGAILERSERRLVVVVVVGREKDVVVVVVVVVAVAVADTGADAGEVEEVIWCRRMEKVCQEVGGAGISSRRIEARSENSPT
jgi:hypothetical protein